MTTETRDLTALIGSRICHDLISPLGAISNGVELLELSGLGDSPEMALISESVQNANARIRFFRVAFGSANDGQNVAEREIRAVLSAGGEARRVEILWTPVGDQPRGQVKLAFLVLQCMETAMPWGGKIVVTEQDGHWSLWAEADRFNTDPALWALITEPDQTTNVLPAQVHYALIAPELARQGRQAEVTLTDNSINVIF
ncbi:histidine phosphotransferase family protein [Aliiroseovarius crassostreae]|uniref:Histidine phosphotransferase n=1 Tax=Aliiroseovarius crassostreae TaxID=154981 RepID=A0A9Q9M0G8_9RHOB|nr:histidine phosphotransferase family protein [Aliiroseovarius crassostreae]UWP96559.1 histidine phosphotransferase [Aliiroseovarius crassostreae]UWP99674.1 histidine phosphotransferase [Aliiroseovarius crassostreae]